MDNLYFVSGLPRSGSTLLLNILGQNPNHYVTPTSGLIELFLAVRNTWKNPIEFKAEGLEKVKPKVESALAGLLAGYFKEEISEEKICFDKSRGWLQFIEDLESCLKREIKVLVTVRDVREILASFEKLYRKRGIDYQYPVNEQFFQCQTIEGRCENLLSPAGILGVTINRFRDALNRGLKDKLIVLPYESFMHDPKETMKLLHEKLEIPEFDYDIKNISQITYENDIYHGMDLHVIRPKIKANPDSWKTILPKGYAENINERYKDINQLSGL